MRLLSGRYEFTPTPTVCPDGVSSKLAFAGDREARPAWRFPDFTAHVNWRANRLERVIREDMREESRYLRNHAQARAAIKDVMEMPDVQGDRVIRPVQANRGKLSRVPADEIPPLREPDVWASIVDAVDRAFGGVGET
ncbi:MAG: hypothetical protein RIS35_1074 [Pseudomonadota bacterium]|jgi:hypothetical protein